MRKLRGLVISWYYPPGNSSEGLVTYKLLRNSEFEYDVFTRKNHNASIWDRKTDESGLTADNVTVYQSAADDEKTWVKDAVAFFKKNSDKYDFIMSRAMPAASHTAACEIKKDFPNVFWIASFGDPLVDSPYIKIVTKKQNPYFLKEYYFRERPSKLRSLHLLVSPTRRARRKVWEKERVDEMAWTEDCKKINQQTFDEADLLIFNNPVQLERAFANSEYARYRDKGIIVNHGFDTDLYPKTPEKTDDGKMHFLYVGHLDGFRNAGALFEALGKLKEYDNNLAQKVTFDFYGHIDDSDKVRIVDNNIGDLVMLHKDVDYLKSLQLMQEADWLILIDTNLNAELEEYIYFPAKLVDYFGAKKGILAITQLKGTSAAAMRAVGAGQVVTHSADEIAMYLAKIIFQGYSPVDYNNDARDGYDIKNIARNFDSVVAERIPKSNTE